ncbi:hypothetical protein HY947_06415 [Candidatus Gottesmanbacteria bacterium]|nr:hypothetical protein [Candidatus Gottesmanbacteria bacterium]
MISFFHRYSRFMQKMIRMVFLNSAYIVGIGPMAILFRMTGKKILQQGNNESSTYQPVSGSDDIQRMY